MTTVFGYVRVSSRDQNEDRQMIALQEQHVPERNIYNEINKLSAETCTFLQTA